MDDLVYVVLIGILRAEAQRKGYMQLQDLLIFQDWMLANRRLGKFKTRCFAGPKAEAAVFSVGEHDGLFKLALCFRNLCPR